MNVDNQLEDLMLYKRSPRKKNSQSSVEVRKLWKMVMFLCIGVATALFIVWIRVQIVQVGYEISDANQKRHELIQKQQWLKMRIVSLRSPERIESLAKKKLDLISPDKSQIRWLK